jgi:hypothetical protein
MRQKNRGDPPLPAHDAYSELEQKGNNLENVTRPQAKSESNLEP